MKKRTGTKKGNAPATLEQDVVDKLNPEPCVGGIHDCTPSNPEECSECFRKYGAA